MGVEKLSDAQIEARLDIIEERIGRADPKDLPDLNRICQMLFDELVRRDLARLGVYHEPELKSTNEK